MDLIWISKTRTNCRVNKLSVDKQMSIFYIQSIKTSDIIKRRIGTFSIGPSTISYKSLLQNYVVHDVTNHCCCWRKLHIYHKDINVNILKVIHFRARILCGLLSLKSPDPCVLMKSISFKVKSLKLQRHRGSFQS